MKCIKNIGSGEIRRVENKEAFSRVGFGWEFIPKSEWKVERGTPKSDEPSERKTKKVKN